MCKILRHFFSFLSFESTLHLAERVHNAKGSSRIFYNVIIGSYFVYTVGYIFRFTLAFFLYNSVKRVFIEKYDITMNFISTKLLLNHRSIHLALAILVLYGFKIISFVLFEYYEMFSMQINLMIKLNRMFILDGFVSKRLT